jgi:hypothetical protein
LLGSLDIETVFKNAEEKTIKNKVKQVISHALISFKGDSENLQLFNEYAMRNGFIINLSTRC